MKEKTAHFLRGNLSGYFFPEINQLSQLNCLQFHICKDHDTYQESNPSKV